MLEFSGRNLSNDVSCNHFTAMIYLFLVQIIWVYHLVRLQTEHKTKLDGSQVSWWILRGQPKSIGTVRNIPLISAVD